MTTKPNNCQHYQDLLISRHVLKDISRTNGEKLDRHLKKCAACRQEEKKLLFLHQASFALPELKTSRSFERKLFRKLDIPENKSVRERSWSGRFWEKFDLLGGRLKPAAAFFSIILIQFVLLRVYFLPGDMKSGSMAPKADTVDLVEPGRELSPLAQRIEDTLAGKNLRTTADTRVRTVRTLLPPKRERKRPAPATSRGIRRSTMRKMSEDSAKTPPVVNKSLNDFNVNMVRNSDKRKTDRGLMKAGNASRNRKISGSGSRRMAMKDTARRPVDQTKKKDTPASDDLSGKKAIEKDGKNRLATGIGNEGVRRNKNRDMKAQGRMELRSTTVRTKQAPRRYKKETSITVTLNTPRSEEKSVRALTPVIRKQIRSMYGSTSRIRFRFALAPEARIDTPRPKENEKTGSSTVPFLVLAVILELTLRTLLIINLKRDGQLSGSNLAIAALLGTLSLPWFFLKKS